MGLLLTTFLLSIASALIPVINVEVYLGGVGALGNAGAFGLAVVASAGQLVGKIVWYEVARRGMHSGWAQKKLDKPRTRAAYERWEARLSGRPVYGGLVTFLAASVGIPPLLVIAVVAGALRMPMWVFVPTVFVGRTIRFYLVIVGVELLFH